MLKRLNKLFIVTIIILLLYSSATATNIYTFSPDFQNNKFDIVVSQSSNDGWYKLRDCAEYLPITVDWDTMTKSVVVTNYKGITQLYNKQRMATMQNDIRIVNETTYCSGRFLCQQLICVSFLYNNDVYVYSNTGDDGTENYIKYNGNDRFLQCSVSSLCQLYVKSIEDYEFITSNLSGGIQYINPEETIYSDTLGYTYPTTNPICYVVGDKQWGAQLAALFGHEAMHIYEHRNGNDNSEETADKYAKTILDKLIYSN